MIRRFLLGGGQPNRVSTDIALIVIRVACGLPMMTVFEKMLPRDGKWGPQEWFISDVAEIGFVMPTFFAWCAVLAEFVGGFLILIGLATRPAAFFLGFTMFVAAFLHHDMDFANKGLNATIFLFLSMALLISGAGRFSLDRFVRRTQSSGGSSLIETSG